MRRTPAHLARHGGDHPNDRTREQGTVRRTVLGLAVVVAAALAGSAAAASLSDDPPPDVEAMLREEIEAMIAAGVPEDHPKVESLREDLRAMERSHDTDAPAEPGVDLGARVDTARERVAAGASGTGGWDRGEVLCEPVPGLLTIDDVADAVCVSAPQPDGTNRYVAIGPDEVAHVVTFDDEGEVARLADRSVPGPIVPGETSVTPTADGDLQITPPGRPPAVADLP
ncbi:MAG: hypothetical protein ACLFXM_07930 [Acidimicrobiia bacterium]